jgi:alpha-1,3-mannosyltransferase
MLFTYGSILAMLNEYWILSCILYSLGLGVKMNVLLFLPGIVYILFRVMKWSQIFLLMILGGLIQV